MEHLPHDQRVLGLLTDKCLHPQFMEQPSVKKRLEQAQQQLKQACGLEDNQAGAVVAALAEYLVPAGTKGVVRGIAFNRIVRQHLETHKGHGWELHFEEHCPAVPTMEKPDWWVCHRDSHVVGFNQIDLWSGGAQTNRGNKYLSDAFHTLPPRAHILCVVGSPIPLFPNSQHKQEWFCKAVQEKWLCYTSGLAPTLHTLLAEEDKNDLENREGEEKHENGFAPRHV